LFFVSAILKKKDLQMQFEFFGYSIDITKGEREELEKAKAILDKHGFKAVRKTADLTKKRASAKKATETRKRATEEKIQAGINLWRLEASEERLTAYKLAKLSGVSQNTAKKYLKEIDAL
jgi:Fic family protein